MATYTITVVKLPVPVVQPPQIERTVTAQQKTVSTPVIVNNVFRR